MNPVFIALVVVVGAVIAWGVGIYNGLVRLRHATRNAWSNIDVLLRQRFDEVPKLVEVCKGYMAHEKDVLERVVRARAGLDSARTPAAAAEADSALTAALRQLFATVEAYPELRSNTNFVALQGRISSIEDQIADRRELYNATAATHNARIEEFPDVVIAQATGFASLELWRTDEKTRDAPSVTF